MAKTKDECEKGHSYYVNGHVARCQNTKCNKVQIYNPLTKSWEDAKK